MTLTRIHSLIPHLILATMLTPAGALAADYHVSTSGSDSNAGTSASPWRTLQKAANSVQAGDVVNVAAGTYLGFQVTADGTSANRIVFRAGGPGVLVNQQNSSTSDNINLEGASYVTIEGFTVEDAPRVGIRAVQATGVTIRNNVVRRSGLTGILSGWTPSIVIENNVVSASADEHGIYVSNSNTPNDNPVIRGNECFGNAKNGVQINGDCWEGGDGIIEGALVEGNVIHDNNWKGFSIISVQASVFQNNVIYDNGISAGAAGLHLADQVGPSCGKPSSNNLIVNNTIVEPRIACIRLTDGSTSNVIFNNLCVQADAGRLIVDEVGGNLIDAASNIDLTSSTGLFVNAASKNFRLATGASAIEAGIPTYQGRGAPAVDKDSVARPVGLRHDAGAYEAGGSATTGDTTPPVVTVIAPAPNSTHETTTTVSANATDNVVVAAVEFLIDGVLIAAADTQAPYTATLDPAVYPTGFYTISARARDDAGNVGVSGGVSVFLRNGSASTGIPSGHPRLSVINGRLEELRALACYDASGNRLTNCTPSEFATVFFNFIDNSPGKADAWHFALAYMISGNPSYADQAISKVSAMVACDYQCIANANNKFLYFRDFMREVCLVYDWCYGRLTSQQRASWINYMNKMLFITWNDIPEANAIFDTGDWATNNPKQNYFYNYLLGTTYVALATYGENPGTFTHSGTQHQLFMLMNARDINSDRYTDVYEFLMAKFSEQMFPTMDTLGVGGGWLEGENYGRAMKRHIFEAFLLLKETAGIDYFNDPGHPFAREAVRYELHTVQPGGGVLYPGGDASQEPTLTVNPYDRHMMLLLAEGLKGTTESQYAQYWLNHDHTRMNGISEMIPVDFFLQQPELPERSYSELPPRYFAEGINWVNSRSAWGDGGVSVTFTCTDRLQGHQHSDQNHFVIYIGGADRAVDGWMLTDVQPYSSSLPRSSHYHNTIVVNNTSQRFGDGTGDMIRTETDKPGSVYALGDASDAYWTNPGEYSHGDEKMVDVFQRELVHILPGYVVAFDRISLTSKFAAAEVKSMFHYPY
ncbi:MAG TPA: right-handed parallel beta-helix repeat-containing protein, partial [Candidatus Krumholzibacteria bacterium]|nr:right-handed parallel beta-helix repeat-containing protein [Candidatus Krumholzibacteria bacterium]